MNYPKKYLIWEEFWGEIQDYHDEPVPEECTQGNIKLKGVVLHTRQRNNKQFTKSLSHNGGVALASTQRDSLQNR